MDISIENLYVDTGARRVKETSGRRGLANHPLVLLAKDLLSTCTLRDLHFRGGSGRFCGKLLLTETTTFSQSVNARCRHWRGKYRLLCEQRLS